MSTRDEWERAPAPAWPIAESGIGTIRLALIFGAAAVAIALIAAPLVERGIGGIGGTGYRQAQSPGIDRFTTGSTGYRGTYTERRSVLQPTPHSVCVIRDNGRRSGDC